MVIGGIRVSKWDKRNKNCSIYLLVAIILGLVFIAALHPVTAYVGGLVYFLLGWTIPTLVNFLITLGIITLLPLKKHVRILLFLPISFLLGISGNIIKIYDYYFYVNIPPEYRIDRKIVVTENNKITVTHENTDNIILSKGLMLPLVIVGGDAGCGCLYFTKRKYTSFNIPIPETHYSFFGYNNPQNIKVTTTKIDAFSAQLTISVYKNSQKVAYFIKKDLPYYEYKQEFFRGEGEEKLLNGYFLSNTLDLLVRYNIWNYLLEKWFWADGVLSKEINNFIKDAIHFT